MKIFSLTSRKLVRVVVAGALCVAVLLGTFGRPGIARAADYKSYADAGISRLMETYNNGNGLWSSGWWQSANALTTVLNYMARGGTNDYSSIIANTYDKNSSGGFKNEYLDDSAWWGLAWLLAYDKTGQTRYRDTAKGIADYMYEYWDTSSCNGGVWWTTARGYKNAITIELYIKLNAALYNRGGGGTIYRDRALAGWNWFYGSGMINGQNLVNDGLNINGSSCSNNNGSVWTYNQGVILGAAAELHRAFNGGNYLNQAQTLADAGMSNLVHGITGALRENACESASCDNDQTLFKGIFMRNFYELNARQFQQRNKDFIQRNADVIWANDRNGNSFGLFWSGVYEGNDPNRQSSATEALIAAIQYSSAATAQFETSLEAGQPGPSWTNSVDYGEGGLLNVGGICCGVPGPELGTRVETAKTGSTALMYSGGDTSSGSSYAYMRVFDLSGSNVVVNSGTTLSYWIYPETRDITSGTNSTCVALDIRFDDGSNLRDSGATTQTGYRAHPAYQCNHLTLNQWNYISVNLSGTRSGRRINRILVGYDQPGNTGGYRGYIDDITVSN